MRDERNYGDELQDQNDDRRKDKDDKPKKRDLISFSKLFDPVSKRTYFIEYQPETTAEAVELDKVVRREGRDLNLDNILRICSELHMRARITQGGGYVGHVFEDGTFDQGVAKELT